MGDEETHTMSNPLEHALIPIAYGAIRSEGRDLIAGEAVAAFYSWPKHTQDMHLNQRKIVLLNVRDAEIAMAKAEEIRNAGKLKEEIAEVKGIESQIQGVKKLIVDLDKQRAELLAKVAELEAELPVRAELLAEKKADEGARPPDEESEALDAKPVNDIHEATGLLFTPDPEETPDDLDDDEDEETVDITETALTAAEIGKIEAWVENEPYRSLQSTAKELGVKGSGVKHADLKASVLAAIIAVETAKRAEEKETETDTTESAEQ